MKRSNVKHILQQLLIVVVVTGIFNMNLKGHERLHKLLEYNREEGGSTAASNSIYDVFPGDFLRKIKNTEGINLKIIDRECIEYPENSGCYVVKYGITFDSFLVSGSKDAPVPDRDAGWVFTDRYNWNHKAYLYIPVKDEKCSAVDIADGAVGKAFVQLRITGNEFIPEDPEVTMALPVASRLRIPAVSLYGFPTRDTPTRNYYSIGKRGREFLRTGILSVAMVNYMALVVMRSLTATSELLEQITGEGENLKITDAVISGSSKWGLTTYISAMLDDRIKGILPFGFTGRLRGQVPCNANTYVNVCADDWQVHRDRLCSDLWLENYDPYFHVNDSRLCEVSLFFTSSTNDYMVPLTTGEEFFDSWGGEKYFFHLAHSGHGGGHPPCDPTNYGKLQPNARVDNALAFTYKVLIAPDQKFPFFENVSTQLIEPARKLYSRAVISNPGKDPEVAFYYSFFDLSEDFDEYGNVKSDFFSMEIDAGECAGMPVECFRDFTTNQWFRIDMMYSGAERGYVLDRPLDVSGHRKGNEVLIFFVEAVSDTVVGPVHITSVFDRLPLSP